MRATASVTLGSERVCSGAEQTSTLVRSECRLPLLLVGPIVVVANVRSPPSAVPVNFGPNLPLAKAFVAAALLTRSSNPWLIAV